MKRNLVHRVTSLLSGYQYRIKVLENTVYIQGSQHSMWQHILFSAIHILGVSQQQKQKQKGEKNPISNKQKLATKNVYTIDLL